MLNRSAVPHPTSALAPPREDLNYIVQTKTETMTCYAARPMTDGEVAAKYAVLLQARRNKLGLEEGDDDTMEPLDQDAVSEIVQELATLFHARPDQRKKRADDQERWEDKERRGNMLPPGKRAKARFKTMIHQLFAVEFWLDQESEYVGAQSPDTHIKKVDGMVVMRDILTHGLADWRELIRIHTVYADESERRARERRERLGTPLQRLRGDSFSGGSESVEFRRQKHQTWKAGMQAATLLGLDKEIARTHNWHYIPEEKSPGALPPGGVTGTELEDRCCGFIWPKMVHGEHVDNLNETLKYCVTCLKLDGRKRWLCHGCRDNRPLRYPDQANCMPGYCPAHERRYNADWHSQASERKRPPWFKKWVQQNPDFQRWSVARRSVTLDKWFRGFIEGRHTQQHSAAQRASRTGVDPWRSTATFVPYESSIASRVMRERPER